MPPHKHKPSAADHPPQVIAVWEHNSALRAVLMDVLGHIGSCTAQATDSIESLEQLQLDHSVEVLLLDLDLPGEDGLHLCRTLRDRYPKLVMVGMSAMSHSDRRVAAMKAGVDHFFPKPVATHELVACLARESARLQHRASST